MNKIAISWLMLCALGLIPCAIQASPTVDAQPGAPAEPTEQDEPRDPRRRPGDPITLISGAAGQNYLNLSLGGLFAAGGSTEPDLTTLQLGSHDPSRRGFTVQNVELVLTGAVDPYFSAQTNIVFRETADGGTETEVEEVYATSTRLPHNLQVKLGHFLTDFGRLNTQHPHTWDFVDQPLALSRMLGSDGLRATGARVSWLMPLKFFAELTLTVQNAFGDTLTSFGAAPGEERFGRLLGERTVRSMADLLYVPRYAASFDLTSNQTILFGLSAALGPNATAEDGRTALYGLDFYWKWKSPRAQAGFPFVKIQGEDLHRRYRASEPDELFEDRGAYAQVAWGFRRGWVVAARYESTNGAEGAAVADPFLDARKRASANLTWFPTEFSKLRLQYSHDQRAAFQNADSVWFQFEFNLGAHAAHKF